MRRPALAVLTCLALAACGTTVPQATVSGTGGNDLVGTTGSSGSLPGGSSSTSGSSTGTGSTGALPGVAGTAGTGSGSGAVPGSTSGTTTSGGGQPSLPGGPALTGRGFTKTTVKIGIATADDSGAFINTLGLNGVATGDYKAQMKAVVDDINAHGGLAGRKIQLVAHDYNSSQLLSDPSKANEAACATWTQDNKVLAVVLPPIVTDNLLQCLKKANTPLINAGIEFPRVYQTVYNRYPDYFHIGAMVGELYDQVSASRLKARGYFNGWNTVTGKPDPTSPVKVGVIIRNDDYGDIQEASVKRSLAKVGITPVSFDHCPSTIEAASCMQSVELKYQTLHVTHVYGNSELTFLNTANSQKYRPRYFMPGTLDLLAQNAPKQEMVGTMGESFTPAADVPDAKDPGPPTVATTRCLALMRKNGQNPTQRTIALGMESYCDGFYFLQAAVKALGNVLSNDVVRRGLEALGTSQLHATTWATRLPPTQHAGTYGLRDLTYSTDGCSCFTYDSRTTYTR